MLITGHLLTSDTNAIESLRELNQEVITRHRYGEPFGMTIDQRVRMEFASLNPLVITKEYGSVIRKGPIYQGHADLAAIILFNIVDSSEVAPVFVVDAPINGFYGFESNTRALNALAVASGMGTRFQ